MANEVKFLCALDLPETIVLSRHSTLRIEGWIIAVDGLRIDHVFVEIDGERPVRSLYPQPRSDVGRYYAGFRNAEASGFITPRIALEADKEHGFDVRVLAQCNGTRHVVHRQRVGLLWFDPDNELFTLHRIGPFLFPAEFDAARLSSFPDCEPLFVTGERRQLAHARRLLSSRGHELRDGAFLVELLRALVECHDVYCEYRSKYFVHFGSAIGAYAVGQFDIYDVMNALTVSFHARVMSATNGGRPAYLLEGKERLLAVPLLRTLYPNARFIHLALGAVSRIGDRVRSGLAAFKGRVHPSDDPDRYENACAERSHGQLLKLVNGGATGERTWRPLRGRTKTVERLLHELGSVAAPTHRSTASPGDGAQQAAVSETNFLGALPQFPDASPVFVLGAGRSGTSAMVGAIKAAGIEGYHEGHVFPMLHEMLKRVAYSTREMRADAVHAVARSTVERVYGRLGNRMWITKTPDYAMIDCVPLIRVMYPRGRFVMMRRHPVAFAESRRRKFGEPLMSAMNEWVKCMQSWKAVKSALAPSSYVERDMPELSDAELNESLADFLGFGAPQRKSLADYLASERPELTRVRQSRLAAFDELSGERLFNARTIFYRMLDSLGEYLDDVAWSDEEKEQALDLLGSLPAEFGYSMDKPESHLLDLLLSWSKAMEQYRHTAEYHEKNSVYWSEIAEAWRIATESNPQINAAGKSAA